MAEEEKTTYERDAEQRLKELGRKIDELLEKASTLEASVREQFMKQVGNLKTQRDTLEGKLRELKSESAQAWGDVRGGFEKAFKDLDEGFKSAVSRFK